MNIYISNLSFDVKSEDLKEFFTPYGEVNSANVIMDKVTSRSRGFGFVEMPDETAAKAAMTALDGSTVDGRVIKVNEAKEKPQRDAFRSGGGNSGNSGGDKFNSSRSYNQNRY